jgi:hypothetical protein
MPFFTKNGATVGTIENYTEGIGTPTSFQSDNQKKPINYNIYDAKDRTIDTTKLSDIDPTNDYVNSGPKDYANYYGNAEAGKLYFTNLVAKYVVVFPAIITSYNESFKPNFVPESVYGRSDTNQKFSNTSRTLSLNFSVVAYDEEHARKNLHALSTLTQFLYPVYSPVSSGDCEALVIRETPLMRVRFSNLIQRSGRGDSKDNYSFSKDGLLTVFTSFTFTPNLEAGFFFSQGSTIDFLYPKEVNVSINLNVLHEESLGWIKTDKKYHWIGKLNSSGSVAESKNVDFPWGNDTIGSDTQISQPASNETVQENLGVVPPANV